jgi:tryptophan synthase beta chain
VLFAQTEGIIPAPESSHAIAAAITEAIKAKEEGAHKTILFNLSGHGLVDMTAYDQYFSGDLANYTLSDEDIAKNIDMLEKII